MLRQSIWMILQRLFHTDVLLLQLIVNWAHSISQLLSRLVIGSCTFGFWNGVLPPCVHINVRWKQNCGQLCSWSLSPNVDTEKRGEHRTVELRYANIYTSEESLTEACWDLLEVLEGFSSDMWRLHRMAKHHAFVSCGKGEKLFRTVSKWLWKKLNHIIRMTIFFILNCRLFCYIIQTNTPCLATGWMIVEKSWLIYIWQIR